MPVANSPTVRGTLDPAGTLRLDAKVVPANVVEKPDGLFAVSQYGAGARMFVTSPKPYPANNATYRFIPFDEVAYDYSDMDPTPIANASGVPISGGYAGSFRTSTPGVWNVGFTVRVQRPDILGAEAIEATIWSDTPSLTGSAGNRIVGQTVWGLAAGTNGTPVFDETTGLYAFAYTLSCSTCYRHNTIGQNFFFATRMSVGGTGTYNVVPSFGNVIPGNATYAWCRWLRAS